MTPAVTFMAAPLIRAWLGTVRTRVANWDACRHPANPRQQRFIYAFWHESLLAPTKIRTRVKVLISRSADGELIGQICRRLGIGTIRGSTTRGGAQGLLEMVRESEDSHLAITPDGPRGPRRRLQPGIIFVASHTGLPIVPVGMGFTRAWRAGSWDRFAVPCPGSIMAGVIGRRILVPSFLDDVGMANYRCRVEDALLAATRAAESWAAQIAAGRSCPDQLPEYEEPSGLCPEDEPCKRLAQACHLFP
jgi:lysophospholipid acyltransferase (LPLAT)-like uncharacterized protein